METSRERKGTNLVGKDTLDTLDSGRLVFLQQVLNSIRDFPVSDSGLDSSESEFSSLVRGLDEVGLDPSNFRRSDDDATNV